MVKIRWLALVPLKQISKFIIISIYYSTTMCNNYKIFQLSSLLGTKILTDIYAYSNKYWNLKGKRVPYVLTPLIYLHVFTC